MRSEKVGKKMKKRGKRKKNYTITKKHLNRRIVILNICFVGVFLFMGWQVSSIKIIKGEEYTKGALSNMIKSESNIAAQRGAIVDRNHKTLATSILAYDVILSPKDILTLKEEKQSALYETLAAQVDKTAVEIKTIVDARPNSQYYILAKKLSTEKVEPLKGLGGVSLDRTYIRKYPSGELAAQVLGFFNKNEQGQYGIEQQYEDYLAGKPGREFSQMEGSQIITRQIQDAQAGGTITLTLDEVIQQYVTTTMEKYIDQYKPLNASAIIMNPNTGEIYSMYSYPSFNPNTYNNLSEQLGASIWEGLSDDKQKEKRLEAWKNHTMQYMYEPGSTMKPIIMAMALEEGIIKGDETYDCPGYKVVADTRIGCWKAGGHGVQTLEEVLANSCNVGMIELTSSMDNGIFLEYVKRFGFGEMTGIELAGEEVGLLHSALGSVDKATYSMGQNLTVTPLQLVTAFSAVVNGGYLMEPYVVSNIVSEDGEEIMNHKKVVRRQVVSSEVASQVTNYLRKVVDDGTGTAAAISGYDIGGKTGTGEKRVMIDGKLQRPEDEYVVSFIGTAPISNPQVVGLVVFDGLPDKTGAPSAAFKEMMENILPYLDVELNVTTEGKESTVSTIPDVTNKSIYEAVKLLEQKELTYEFVGMGSTVKDQAPKAGAMWSKGGSVKLYLTTEQLDQIEEVPDLVGKTVEEANALVEGKFILEGITEGIIASQMPEAGTKIEKNNKIIVKTTE